MNTGVLAEKPPRTTRVGFHEGGMLMHVARTYPFVMKAILEAIQNAIDIGAKRIELRLCKETRSYCLYDNGKGASVDEFNKALNEIGMSSKDPDKYGRFGLGLVANVDKCEEMTFTSRSRTGSSTYHRWTFRKEDIANQEKVEIPIKQMRSLSFEPQRSGQNPNYVWWLSQMQVTNYTSDKRQGEVDLAVLNESIVNDFRKEILKGEILIRLIEVKKNGDEVKNLRVQARGFKGKKITEWTSNHFEESGNVHIRLFLSKEGGKVYVGDNTKTTKTLKQVGRSQIFREKLGTELYEALISGYFEGELLCDKLALNPDREGFADNDALVGFGLCINAWWEEQGKSLYNLLKDTKKQDRYQQLGMEALQHIETILSMNDSIRESLKKIGSAIIGFNNASPSSSTNGNALGTRGAPYEPRPGEKFPGEPRSKAEKPVDTPINSVEGPKGMERRVAKSRYGIHITHNSAATFSQLWRFDIATGELEFNITNPLWVECDDRDWKLVSLQEECVREAVTTLLYDDETRIRLTTDVQEARASMFVGSLKHGALRRGVAAKSVEG